jgi:hypothetical protein
MDCAKKYLNMGVTRSLRYYRHKSGKKYDGPVPKSLKGISGAHGRLELPLDYDPIKEKCAEAFYWYYQLVLNDLDYQKARRIIKSWRRN